MTDFPNLSAELTKSLTSLAMDALRGQAASSPWSHRSGRGARGR
jgi:hypothetical protein